MIARYHLPRLVATVLCCLAVAGQPVQASAYSVSTTATTTTLEQLEQLEQTNTRAAALTSVSPDEALVLARQVLARAQRDSIPREQARALATIGVVMRFQDNYDSALIVHERARVLFEQLRDTVGLADIYMFISGVHQSRGNYTGVMENGYRSLALSERLGDQKRIARAFANIGTGYALKREYAQAMDFQRRALQIRREQNDQHGVAHSLRNLGLIFEEMNQLDSALSYFQRSLDLFSSISNTQGIALATGSLGTCYEKMNNAPKAREYLFKVMEWYERLGDRRGLAVTLNALASSYAKQKRYGEALFYADRGLTIAEKIGALVEQRDALHVLTTVRTELGDESSALAYFRRFVAIKDSLTDLQNLQRIAELQGRYDLEQQRRERADAENDRNAERIKADTLRNSLVVATIVFLGVVAVIANGYRIKRRSEQVLRSQNEEIRRQQDQLRQQAAAIAESNQRLHEANTLLADNNTELVQLNHEKNEFLGIAAHDLKNPLANTRMTAQMLAEYGSTASDEQLREWTSGINRSMEYMLNIVTNLLDVNKIDTGAIALVPEPVETSLVEIMCDAYSYRAQEKNITLHCNNQAPEAACMADRGALQQMLENLISNAIKFSPPEKNVFVSVGVRVGVRVGVSQHQSSNQAPVDVVRIAVADEGPGISADDQAKLFGKFARLSAQPTGGEHSTGLGLSIVKRLAEAMGGRVWCESELGKGATFVLELPMSNGE
jgi:signal transduction histidine kinase